MSYPDYELNGVTTEENILKMLQLIYEKMRLENETNKLFYVKLPFNEPKAYLNHDKDKDEYFFSTKAEVDNIQTKFTQEEINKMQEDFDFGCSFFEKCKVPVEEDE